MPAADLSEQISTAGKEASGTGNMKLALNGALTIGTLDGANIEIRDEVGAENIFIFGLKADEVSALLANGYDPQRYLHQHRWMRRALDSIAAGHFSRGDKDIFRPILANLLSMRDEYLHLADLPAYVERQRDVDVAYLDQSDLAAQVAAQHRPHGQVLLGSHDRRIRARDLEHSAGDGGVDRRTQGMRHNRRAGL